MKTIQEIADTVTVRNHLSLLLNGSRNAVKKGDVAKLSALILKLDTEILADAMVVCSAKTEGVVVDDIDFSAKIAEEKAKMAAAREVPALKKALSTTNSSALPPFSDVVDKQSTLIKEAMDALPTVKESKPKKMRTIKRVSDIESDSPTVEGTNE